jgi:hypothetical protein
MALLVVGIALGVGVVLPQTAVPAQAAAVSVSFKDPSFELKHVRAWSARDKAGAWKFVNQAGIQHNHSSYSRRQTAPNGVQTGFVRGRRGKLGSMSERVTFGAGTYSVAFSEARRRGYGAQPVRVRIDSALVGTYVPTSTSFVRVTTSHFVVKGGTHTVSFSATKSSGDGTTFLDSMTINSARTAVASVAATATASDINLTGYGLTFDDEFASLSLSATSPKGAATWYAHPPYGPAGNYSASNWTASSMSVANGVLSDTANFSSNQWTSGNLSSMDETGAGFSQKYGYFEARMKMPDSGTGAWPAFWLLSSDSIPAVSSNAVDHEEIDVLEWYGNTNAAGDRQPIMQEATHNWNADGSQGQAAGSYLYSPYTPMPAAAFPSDGFHTYGVKVEAAHITWYIDGVQTNQIATPAKYLSSPFYMMIDYALGGGWPLTGMINASSMQVDWVRVYALPGS